MAFAEDDFIDRFMDDQGRIRLPDEEELGNSLATLSFMAENVDDRAAAWTDRDDEGKPQVIVIVAHRPPNDEYESPVYEAALALQKHFFPID